MKNYYKQKQRFDDQFERYIHNLTQDTHVKNIIFDATSNGKRIRPIIVMEITRFILGKPIEDYDLAIAIELIHNASLVLDDMPMMDNDCYRRNKPTLHFKYSEKIALFIADLFMQEASQLMFNYCKKYVFDKNTFITMFSHYHDNLGLNGIIGGQLLDLSPLHSFDIYSSEKFNNSTFLQMLNEKKTTTLFNLCFIVPTIVHNHNNNLPLVKMIQISKSFGLTFQLADDIEDLIQDQKRQNESGITCNFCLQIGNQETIHLFKQHMATLDELTRKYNIHTPVFQEIMDYLKKKVVQ